MTKGSGFAERLSSRRLALALLLATAAVALPGTLASPARIEALLVPVLGDATLPVARFLGLAGPYRSPVFLLLVGTLALSIAACTWHRISLRRSAASAHRHLLLLDALVHLSLLAIIAGAVAKGYGGFIRTRNIHVGTAAYSFYDAGLDADIPLGFGIEVAERVDSYYPVKALIGVRDRASGVRIALLEVVEGRDARLNEGDLRLRFKRMDPATGAISFAAVGGGAAEVIDLEVVAGGKSSLEFGAYTLSLVAWRQDLKGVRARLSCLEGSGADISGWISPQERMACNGVKFALTAWGTDQGGKPFIGVQAVREPGAPVFWGGCTVLAVVLPMFLALRARGQVLQYVLLSMIIRLSWHAHSASNIQAPFIMCYQEGTHDNKSIATTPTESSFSTSSLVPPHVTASSSMRTV